MKFAPGDRVMLIQTPPPLTAAYRAGLRAGFITEVHGVHHCACGFVDCVVIVSIVGPDPDYGYLVLPVTLIKLDDPPPATGETVPEDMELTA